MSRTKTLDYHEYLRSDAWRTRRGKVFAAARKTCLGCGRPAECVHHRTYARLGREADADLVALCWDCHQAAHLYHVEHADMGLWVATDTLIAERRALFGLPPVRLPGEGLATRPQKPPVPAAPGPVRAEIRSVQCPKCAAGTGEPCQSSSGNPRPANHQLRVAEYQRQARGEPPSRVRSPNRRFKNHHRRKRR